MSRIQFLGIGLAAILATGCTEVAAAPADTAPEPAPTAEAWTPVV